MTEEKIKKLKELKDILAPSKRKGKKIVFTNGCFDLLHPGHVKYLEQASSLGDELVVAINGDDSVRRIKGRLRPVIPEQGRATLIAALECVNYVTIFTESTPLRLIKALRPDVLVKGADWPSHNIVGKDFVESYGGKVVCVELVKGYSTSSIIAKIREVY